jgi:peptidoglycan hydrolase-like protein with peptidoglycan-binding domain
MTRGDDTPTAQSLATTTARRETLTQTVDASFALAKDGTSTLATPAAGTVTSVAITQGKAVKALTRLAGVNGAAVYGIPPNYPLYRGLAEGDEGPDVTALQKALAAAGYDPGEADGDFGSGTADALADWQADQGLGRPAGWTWPRSSPTSLARSSTTSPSPSATVSRPAAGWPPWPPPRAWSPPPT